jgi:hypothetical protein
MITWIFVASWYCMFIDFLLKCDSDIDFVSIIYKLVPQITS